MIVPAGKYADVRAAAGAAARIPVTFAPDKRFYVNTRPARKREGRMSMAEFMARELREGRLLHEHFARRKAGMRDKIRACAQIMQNVQPNPKSEFKLKAAIPAELFWDWRRQDKHFWSDPANYRRLRSDDPDMEALIKK
jgi:hypothetical protein